MKNRDFAVDAFLELLARDIEDNPDQLIPATEMDRTEILDLVGDFDIDIDTLEITTKQRPNTSTLNDDSTLI
ncbi:hypothetical protein BCU19_14895 [Vibrio cyclitrophicus]|uniref:hypothetical protein n=1 Tax=Vibrio TaxID=662 RepID=UPI000634630A|nr:MULTISPECIES: hypothetical protein [Vibrio]PMJ51419.1 hypothetical protein BCU19_05850 [Vibrio cyclitrophicus]CDT52360.1 hypothetical protein VCR1J2_610003 [Vibrio coralliirubri]